MPAFLKPLIPNQEEIQFARLCLTAAFDTSTFTESTNTSFKCF